MKLKLKFILSLAIIQYVAAVCNVCNENGVACINDKDFFLCESGQAKSSTKFSCSGEKICTRLPEICVERSENTTVPACGDTSNCGKCEGAETDGIYTCTSRTTYTMCFGGALSNIRDTCPENQMCDISLGKTGQIPCVPNCRESQIEFCDLYQAIDETEETTTPSPATTTVPVSTTSSSISPVTTTTELTDETTLLATTTTEENQVPKPTTEISSVATTTENSTTEQVTTTTQNISTTKTFAPTPPSPTTTITLATTTTNLPSTTQSPAEVFCSQQTAVGRYAYPNDTTCKNYVYCYKKGGVMQTTLLKCPNESFFNTSTSLCGKAKPQGCI